MLAFPDWHAVKTSNQRATDKSSNTRQSAIVCFKIAPFLASVLNREHQLLDAGAIVFLPEIVGLKAPVFRLGVLVLRHSHRFRSSLFVRAVDSHLAVKTISHPPHF